MRRASIAAFFLAVSLLACRTGPSTTRTLNLYPSPTSEATQTPFVVEITTTPVPTTFVVITATSKPTVIVSIQLCVSAEKAVNLRPSANDDGYPILQLSKGDKVVDLGGRNENWFYVQYRDKKGWINSRYLKQCK